MFSAQVYYVAGKAHLAWVGILDWINMDNLSVFIDIPQCLSTPTHLSLFRTEHMAESGPVWWKSMKKWEKTSYSREIMKCSKMKLNTGVLFVKSMDTD